ncbi:hypothetical protein ACA910_001748 [Epithemia clementina (nom. ined.)]
MATPQPSRKILVSQENLAPRVSCAEEDRKPQAPPKNPRSPFICFTDAKRKEVIAKNPNLAGGDILSIVAKQWSELSARERAFWDEEARNDKVRFVREKAEFKGVLTAPKRRARKPKDAPKRPMSAFLKFSQTRRNMVRTANPELNNTDVSRLLGEIWRNASPAEQRPYVEQEKRERAQYKAIIKKWREKQAQKEASSKSISQRATPSTDQQTDNGDEQSYASMMAHDHGLMESFQLQSLEEAAHKADERTNNDSSFFVSASSSDSISEPARSSAQGIYRHRQPLSSTYHYQDQDSARGTYYGYSQSPHHVHSASNGYHFPYGYGNQSQPSHYYPRSNYPATDSNKYYGDQNPRHFGAYHYP